MEQSKTQKRKAKDKMILKELSNELKIIVEMLLVDIKKNTDTVSISQNIFGKWELAKSKKRIMNDLYDTLSNKSH